MFNMYTKVATALGAFALLFSTGAWGQCADGEIAVDFALSAGDWPGEITWQLNDSTGANLFTGGAPDAAQWCLTPGDYTFIGSDSYGDGWNGAVATFSSSGVSLGSLAVEGATGSIVISVSADIPGCTDAAASNYNPDATVDDGSCCLANIVTIELNDSFGDGWSFGSGGQWGGFILNGDSTEFASGSSLSFDLCVDEGCYTAQISMGAYGAEASWSAFQNGQLINSGSGAGGGGTTFDADFFFYSGSGDCAVFGCNDVNACNYTEGVNLNDGSCEYLSCAGCIDPTACNYDDTATLDNGTCDYSCVGCLDPNALNYCADCTIDDPESCISCPGIQYQFTIFDSFGDGICCAFGEGSYSVSLDGEVVLSGGDFDSSESGSFCAEDSTACVVVSLVPDNYPGETTWELANAVTGEIILSGDGTAGSFGTADCVAGCNDAGACNYDATADINDGSCDYSCLGCTDSAAANYNPEATVDNGDCVYCDPGTFILNVDMADSFGDGWGGVEYYLYDLNSGALVDSGSIETAFIGDGLSTGLDLICLAPGCYNFQTIGGGFDAGEASVTLDDQFGTVYGTVSGTGANYGVDFTLTGLCSIEGCTDAAANNYNPSASTDDGSCQSPPANDDVANAEALACDLSASGTLQYANDNEGLEGLEFGNDVLGSAGVWYVINSDADQQITLSTCDTPINDGTTDYAGSTDIAIFTQDLDGNLTVIATNNDGCTAGGFHSTITWTAETAQDYYARVEGGGGSEFVISASCNPDQATSPANDDCTGAVEQATGVTFTGNLCGANAEGISIFTAGNATAYGVYFTFNSSNYDTFLFNATNISNDVLGFMMLDGNTCDDLSDFVGCQFTGTCAGSVESFLSLEPNTDYYFLIYTTDQDACGDFEFTTTGILLGCTDAAANNYNPEATQDDGSCDFAGVTPANDSCADAIELACNAITTGSTGGATNVGSPLNVAGCEAAPGTGVWYTFVGDGSYHTLSTCGSAIDTKINIYSADTACGGGSITTPPADACGEGLVTTNYSVGGGTWDSEITWSLADTAGVEVAGGAAPTSGSLCLPAGDYILTMNDSYGDGWNGASAAFTDGLGDVMGVAGLETGNTGTATITVAPYSMEPIFIAGDFTCVASATSSDGNGICTLFDADDVNFEFISEPGLLYYVYVGAQDTDGNPATDDNGAFDIDFTCNTVIEGCQDPAACNYNPDANVDSGDCDIWSCVCPDSTGTPIQFYMYDSYGDGWNGATYTVTDLDGNPVASGNLDDAAFSVDADNFTGPEFGYDLFCLDPGCYSVIVEGGDWPSEVTWTMFLEDGSILAEGAPIDGVTISIGGAVCGCTDAGACNYDETATDDDGSCEFESCAGCTDSTACNYDADALIEDGSCCFDNCVSVNMSDSFGDGWNGAAYTLTDVNGTELGSGTIDAGSAATDTYCLEAGCYIITVSEGTFPGEVSWNIVGAFGGVVAGGAGESVTFNVGSGDQCVVDCDIACACNYNPATNISDVSLCVFDGCSGCTYPDAENYDETAVSDDGSCSFDIANPCPADLNGDGSVSTADLLEFLTAFGQIC